MEKRLGYLIFAGMLLLILFFWKQDGLPFYAILASRQVDVNMALNIKNMSYESRVTLSYYDPVTRNTYVNFFVLRNIDTKLLKEYACYLYVDEVRFKGAYGVYYTWKIRNVTLKAPLKGNVCDFFSEGVIANPETSYYIFIEYSPASGITREYTYTCKDVKCKDKMIAEGDRVEGLLVLYLRDISKNNCTSLTSSYCVNESSFEVREYYCPAGYGTNEMCLTECKYRVVVRKDCGENYVCVDGKCVETRIIEKIIEKITEKPYIPKYIQIAVAILIILVIYLIARRR